MLRKRIERVDGTAVEICVSERADGDFHMDAEPTALRARRASLMPGAWHVVRQVHGARVAQPADGQQPEADGLVTSDPGVVIAVQGADCAPIAVIGSTGAVAVAHAGWRGVHAGVIDAAVHAVARTGSEVAQAVVGPTIGPGCYEFSPQDLETVVSALGEVARSTTTAGNPALDLPSAIDRRLRDLGVSEVEQLGSCTACDGDWFSHRARRDEARHAMALRIVAS